MQNKKIIFFLFFVLMLFSAVWASAKTSAALGQQPIKFQADALEYQQNDSILTATGNIVVEQTSFTFKSDYALFNLDQKMMFARENVDFYNTLGDRIRCRFLTYNFVDSSAELSDAAGQVGPWLFDARHIQRTVAGQYILDRARLSTCERDLNKYHLYGRKIVMVPTKRLVVHHAVFRVGIIPIFYLPYYYQSLGEKHLAFQIFPGQNNSEGFFLRTIWGYPISPDFYAKVYLDHLSRRGFGKGTELNYAYGGRAKGSFYVYQVDDKIKNGNRWNTRFYHWQRLSPNWIVQANANRMSDDNFSNDFVRDDYERVARDLETQAAVTYQNQSYSARLTAQTQDLYNVSEQKFYTNQALAPQLEISQNQMPLGFWQVYKNWRISAKNIYGGNTAWNEPLARSYRTESDGEFSLVKTFPLTRWTSYAQRLTLAHFATDKVQGSESSENFTQRGILEGTLRQRLLPSWDVDLVYLFDQRLQNNQGNDLGRVAHQLSFLSWYQPSSQTTLRFETAHYLPGQRGQALAFLDRARYAPLRAELAYNPNEKTDVFFRQEYVLSDANTGAAHVQSSQAEVVFGRRAFGEDYFSLGSSYFSDQDRILQLRQGLRTSWFKGFQLEAVLRANFTYRNQNTFDVERVDFVEKQIVARRQWRCWNIMLTFRERKGVYEFLFNIEMQMESSNRAANAWIEKNSEFYPWR